MAIGIRKHDVCDCVSLPALALCREGNADLREQPLDSSRGVWPIERTYFDLSVFQLTFTTKA